MACVPRLLAERRIATHLLATGVDIITQVGERVTGCSTFVKFRDQDFRLEPLESNLQQQEGDSGCCAAAQLSASRLLPLLVLRTEQAV